MPPETTMELRAQLNYARCRTDEIFQLLAPGALYDRAVDERHRFLFYLGHLEAFDANLLGSYALSLPSPNPAFDQLFAFGIDPDSSGLPTDTPSDWPSPEHVAAYCAQVRNAVDRHLHLVPEQLAHVAIEHRLMHAETLAYLLHNLPLDRKVALHDAEPPPSPGPLDHRWCEIASGRATLDRPRDGSFGWDNEFDATGVNVPAFAIASHKVTNGDYLRFVADGGSPSHFWRSENGDWLLRTMFNQIPLPLDWPVYVTHRQARDYAQWSGHTLPSEAQFHRAAEGAPVQAGNVAFARWDPVPVNATPAAASTAGISQLRANGWEWTRDLFRPLPGFEPFDFYPGYSANFFDDDHYVLKGASPRTAPKLLRPSFRNWFRDDYKYVFATFRCVEE